MSEAAMKRSIPGRAIASVVFACFSLWMFRVYGEVHWLPMRFSRDGDEMFHRILSQVGPIRDQLDIGYRVLALAALVWCVWSWRTEHRMAAVVATVFAALAVFCAVCIMV
jgi:hypothetical protein